MVELAFDLKYLAPTTLESTFWSVVEHGSCHDRKGVSQGQYYKQFLKPIVLNKVLMPYCALDVWPTPYVVAATY